MLNVSTLEYTCGLAEQLKEAGVGIRAIAYTPMASVVMAAYPTSSVYEQQLKTKPDLKLEEILHSVTKNDVVESEHSGAVAKLSDQLASYVKVHISNARNEVRPVVTEYAEKVLNRIQTFKYDDPAGGFKISKVYIPEPLLTDSFLDDLRCHKGRQAFDIQSGIDLGTCTDEELVQNLFTGHNSTDAAIREWLMSFDNSLLRKVWTGFFNNNGPLANVKYNFNYEENLNASLAIYLYSRKFTNNVKSVPGMNSIAYNSALANLESYAGAIICGYISELNLATTSERLILSISSYSKSAIVYGPVYDKFLNEGGSANTILGMLVDNISATTLVGVRAVTDKANLAWNRYITLSNYNNKKNRAELLRSIYISEYVSQLDSLSEFEKEYHAKNPGFADVSFKLTKDYINTLTEAELEDINAVSMKAIACIRFKYTQAYQILCDMEEAMKANPDLDPREAATIAVINLVTDYVSMQLQRF